MLKIEPKGKQKSIMSLPVAGQYVILGTAGSGKTTMAMLRALHLAGLPEAENVLLVTFNRALVKYMRNIGGAIPPNLTVENYHKFARGYLKSRDKMPSWNGILDSANKPQMVEQALNSCREKNPTESTFKRSLSFFTDEIKFIQEFGFLGFEEYYKTERIGRASANIKRDNRKWIFEVYEGYLNIRKLSGVLYDWEDLALHTYLELLDDDSPRRYKHIIIDEGQDFSPMMIKSLVNAVASGGSFTFFGDVAQQIYGNRLSWRDSGIQVQDVIKMNVNYRNPVSISAYSNEFMQNKYWVSSEDVIQSEPFIAEGPKPALVWFHDAFAETEWLVKQAISVSRSASTAVIVRRRSEIDILQRMIQEKGGTSVEIDKALPDCLQNKVIYLTTYHAAKGLEFENVFIPYLSADRFPDEESFSEAPTTEDAFANELKLLYVAVTRSKYGLFLTYSGSPSLLIPAGSQNCDWFEGDAVA